MIDGLDQYCTDVLSGKIPSGTHLKSAVNRFASDIASLKWHFDEAKVNKVIKFIAKLKHFTGKHVKQHFILEPWQVFIIANLYGFYNEDSNQLCLTPAARGEIPCRRYATMQSGSSAFGS